MKDHFLSERGSSRSERKGIRTLGISRDIENEGTCGSCRDGMERLAFTGKYHYMVRGYREMESLWKAQLSANGNVATAVAGCGLWWRFESVKTKR
jgi:hypothetical protein